MVKVAEHVLEIENIDVGMNPTIDEIWTVLLAVISNKSKYQIDLSTTKLGTEGDIAHFVLGTLLDIACSCPELDKRKVYIERIMSLPKGNQKILMSIIERRKKFLSPRKSKGTSSSSTPSSSIKHNKLLSSKILCGAADNLVSVGSGVKQKLKLKPILKHGSKAKVNKSAAQQMMYQQQQSSSRLEQQYSNNDNNNHNNNNNSSIQLQQPEQLQENESRGYSTPPRERMIPIAPQSEPRNVAFRDQPPLIRAPQSERKFSRSRHHMQQRNYDIALNNIDRRLSGIQSDLHQHHNGQNVLQSNMAQILPPGQVGPGVMMQQYAQQHHFQNSIDSSRQQEHFSSPTRGRPSDKQNLSSPPFQSSHTQSPFMPPSNGTQEQQSGKPSHQNHPHPTFATMESEQQTMLATPSDEVDTTTSDQNNEQKSHAATSATDASSETSLTTATSTAIESKPPGRVITISKRKSSEGFSSPGRARRMSSSSQMVLMKTPERALAMYEQDVEGRMMLSPAESMLQSPMQLEDFVKELRAKNKNLESVLVSYQKRERELSQKMESTETKLRKEMMKLESRALGREDELRDKYENEVTKLKKELRMEKEKNKDSKKAQEDLAMANDELELMQHTQEKLQEATEKLRKYKERLDAMNDYKEALQREQEAHSKSVEECVRLENELNLLQPLKRQLEDYKAKAIETEVQLVECKDELARLERERNEIDGARNDVLKEAHAQREQAEELRKFIKLDENGESGPGIGEGIR